MQTGYILETDKPIKISIYHLGCDNFVNVKVEHGTSKN